MAIALRGLRVKNSYEQLIGVSFSDELENVEFLNRDATFLRNGFVSSQLDGEGMRTMERQLQMASKESYKEHSLKQIATNTGANIHDLRNDSHQEMRTDRVEKAVHFDTSQDDDVPMTASSGVQAEAQMDSTGVQAKAQTTSSGSQSSKTKMDQFGGTQTTTIKMKDRGSQATEDRSEEIEQLRQASELEKQVLIDQHEQNIERVRQQVTEQVMAQAEAEHSKKKECHKQESLEKAQITEAEAQRQINQAQHQAQQEAKQYVGSVIQYAEQAHIDQLSKEKRAKREHMNQLRKEKEQAELERLRTEMAERRAKRAETSEHNTEYKATPATPDNRAKPPKKQKQVLHDLIIILNIMLIIKMSKHPIIDQRLKQTPDLRLIKTYHHSLQEKKHLGVKINQKTIILNRITNLKENEVGHEILNQIQILKDHLLLKRIT